MNLSKRRAAEVESRWADYCILCVPKSDSIPALEQDDTRGDVWYESESDELAAILDLLNNTD